MKPRRERWLYFLLTGWALLAFCLPFHHVRAESSNLEIGIVFPRQGETLYAGPSSLLYVVPIRGWVHSSSETFAGIAVTVEILKNGQVIDWEPAAVNEDGSFTVEAVVNPNGSTGTFPAEQTGCFTQCHHGANLVLAPGVLVVRITARDEQGHSASAERQITVDHSQAISFPVQVILAETNRESVPGVPVSSSARLYLWRTRNTGGVTDSQGLAQIQVEVLSEAPTRYRFAVEPCLVDGVLYESIQPVEITLEPGQRPERPVVIEVSRRMGSLHGHFQADHLPPGLQIYLVDPDTGSFTSTPLNQEGMFAFESLPVARYVISLDPEKLVQANLAFTVQEIDLLYDHDPVIDFDLVSKEEAISRGMVVDENRQPLPFAWLANPDNALAAQVLPTHAGSYWFLGSEAQRENFTASTPLIASAPGYYSRAVSTSAGEVEEFQLTRRPETGVQPWGAGEVILPPETHLEASQSGLRVDQGWVWGDSRGPAQPLVINAGATEISLSQGRFALAYLPAGRSWFFLESGQASLSAADSERLEISAGQIVFLDSSQVPQAIEANPAVLAALIPPGAAAPIDPVWQPGLAARFQNGLAFWSVSLAKVITFITYGMVIITVGITPLVIVYWWLKRRIFPQIRPFNPPH